MELELEGYIGQRKNLERCKRIFVCFGTDPREKRDDSRRGDNREYLRGEKGWIQSPDGGDLGFAKSRDTPFIASGGKKTHSDARGFVYLGQEDEDVFLLLPSLHLHFLRCDVSVHFPRAASCPYILRESCPERREEGVVTQDRDEQTCWSYTAN